MKIVLNEIIDQLYEAVKKCDIDSVGVQPVMRCLGRLKGRYSESLLLEAMHGLLLHYINALLR